MKRQSKLANDLINALGKVTSGEEKSIEIKVEIVSDHDLALVQTILSSVLEEYEDEN